MRIDGNYGVYTTRLQIGRLEEGHCTCPSDWHPCKHLRALQATWEITPDSFFDLDEFLDALLNEPIADLVWLIGEMALAAPEALSACGFEEFEPERDDFYDG